MSQVVLNQLRVGALVGAGEATRVTQQVRVRLHGQACALALGADRQPGRHTAEWATPLTEKERVCLRFHSRTLSQPGFDRPELVTPERVRRGPAVFQARDVQHTAVRVHMGQP